MIIIIYKHAFLSRINIVPTLQYLFNIEISYTCMLSTSLDFYSCLLGPIDLCYINCTTLHMHTCIHYQRHCISLLIQDSIWLQCHYVHIIVHSLELSCLPIWHILHTVHLYMICQIRPGLVEDTCCVFWQSFYLSGDISIKRVEVLEIHTYITY